MKLKIFLLIIGLIAIKTSIAQEIIFDKVKEFSTKSKEDISKTTRVRIKIVKAEDNSFTIHLNTDSAKVDYTIKPLQFDTFEPGFYRAFKKATKKELSSGESGNIKLLFMDVLINTMQEEKSPLAGKLNFADTILVGKYVELELSTNNTSEFRTFIFTKKEWNKAKSENVTISREEALDFALSGKSLRDTTRKEKEIEKEKTIIREDKIKANYDIYFIPGSTQIEFTNSYIQNITISGDILIANSSIQKMQVVFSSKIPIGFSSIRDYKALDKYNLSAKFEHKDNIVDFEVTVPVSDFLEYNHNLRLNTRNYCPKNDVISVELPSNYIKLYKEPTSKILEARVFTDILGIQGGNPNGIIQTEVEKRINMLTRRHKSLSKTNFGFVQYIKPFAILNKIEDKDRYLELDTGSLDSLKTNFLDLYQYESFRTGIEANAFLFDVPFGKANIHINGGIAFGKVQGTDTANLVTARENKRLINTLHLYGKIKFKVIPDERYGITFSYQLGHYNALNNDIIFQPIDDTGNNKNWLQNIEIFAFWNIGESGNIFFRYRLNCSLDNWNYNFSQLQFGYSFNITKQIKKTSKL